MVSYKVGFIMDMVLTFTLPALYPVGIWFGLFLIIIGWGFVKFVIPMI